MVTLRTGTSLRAIVNTLNSLGASPDDTMAILQALHEAGALDADLVVI
jgi:flagellar P-ring protein precursor FlgI